MRRLILEKLRHYVVDAYVPDCQRGERLFALASVFFVMVEIPDTLRSVFTTAVESDDGSYSLEVPASEVHHDAIQPGETYRIVMLEAGAQTARSEDRTSDPTSGQPSAADKQDSSEPPVEKGEIRDVSIQAVGDQGDGIARVGRGYVVIVPEGEPGEEPTVEIEQVRQNVAFAKIVEPDP